MKPEGMPGSRDPRTQESNLAKLFGEMLSLPEGQRPGKLQVALVGEVGCKFLFIQSDKARSRFSRP